MTQPQPNLYAESVRAFLKPVVQYLDDPKVTEIMINGPEDVWVERKGKLHKTEARFTEQGLLAAARNMAQFVGRPLTEERARLDARLPDGSRIHIVLAPVARKGTTISIRKFSRNFLSVEQLIESGAWTNECARFVAACVIAKRNLIVSGGTGSGKTTLLNILSTFIPDDERILTIEDSAELQLQQQHLVPLEARPADQYGKGGVTIQDLLHSALRLRPDRIIVGEVRGGECFDMLQALNTGHGGSMSTVHANSPIETLSRLESLTLLSGVDLPLRAVRAQVAASIHVIVCCARYADGSRRISHVTEVLPLDDRGDYRVRDIFVFTEAGRDAEGNVLGQLAPTGQVPSFLPKLVAAGFEDFTKDYFRPETYGYAAPAFFTKA